MRVVVIGAGIVGAAAAWELVRAGTETVLVDAGHEGRATAAGAGIICPWTGRTAGPLAVAGAAHYPGLLAALAEDGVREVGHRRVGALVLLPPDRETAAGIEARVAARAAADPNAGEVTTVDADEARRLFPALAHRGDGFRGTALHLTGAARLDGRSMRAALVSAAERRGLRSMSGAARLALRGARVRGVRVAGELVEADAVIAAAGAWSAELLEPAGIRLDVVPQRGQLVHLRLPGAETGPWPVVLPAGTGHYLLTFDDSRVVAGATREDGTGFAHRTTAAGLAEVLRHALAVAPGLADAEHLETRVGFRPVSPDGDPLLGTVPGAPGLVVATGLGSGGLTTGPYAGALAARLALGRDPAPAPGLELSRYAPQRGRSS
ncbi:FAD-dependent oxidoreductase [Streptomyces sp. NPDC006990]|uniref:NAD(P)/FAD-dependent oxidoreductase n=1 Tax=Streptomyces sp. NPDC006990 TaxID=3154481 RepID=UPI003456AD51